MPLSLNELQERVGYRFRNPDYLRLAVTHSSFANETGAQNHHILCNERLEFFGDSVLQLISSEYLYHRYPNLPEGDLTRVRSAVVCEEALCSYGHKIGLGDFLLLGRGERNSGGAYKPALIADAFEALLAAICLDAGGIDGVRRAADFLLPFLKGAVDAIPVTGGFQADYKSRLQEFVQKDNGKPEYRLVEEKGPDHNKTFLVEVYLDSNCIGKGSGHSKKHAEQAAAKAALGLFGIDL